WEAVSVRQPPLPPPGGDFAIALGLALGKAY
ncbi:DNA utilization protein HofM, partial [Klebsiella pneumoniae subsp. pneumoniae]